MIILLTQEQHGDKSATLLQNEGCWRMFSLGLKTKNMELKELGERKWPAEVPITQNVWEIRFCLFPGTHAICVWLGIVLLIFPTCSQAL